MYIKSYFSDNICTIAALAYIQMFFNPININKLSHNEIRKFIEFILKLIYNIHIIIYRFCSKE